MSEQCLNASEVRSVIQKVLNSFSGILGIGWHDFDPVVRKDLAKEAGWTRS